MLARRGHLRALRRRGVRDHRARHGRRRRPRRWPSGCARRRGPPVLVRGQADPRDHQRRRRRARPRAGVHVARRSRSRVADETMYAAKRAGRNRVCVRRRAAESGRRPAPAHAARRASARSPRERASRRRASGQVVGARDVDRAEALQVRRRHLRVEQREAARAQPLDQVGRRRPWTRRCGGGTSIRRRRSRRASRRRARRRARRPPRPRRCGRGRAGAARVRRTKSSVIQVAGARPSARAQRAHDAREVAIDGERASRAARGAPDAAVRAPASSRSKIARGSGDHQVRSPDRTTRGRCPRGRPSSSVSGSSEPPTATSPFGISAWLWFDPSPDPPPDSSSDTGAVYRTCPGRPVRAKPNRHPGKEKGPSEGPQRSG